MRGTLIAVAVLVGTQLLVPVAGASPTPTAGAVEEAFVDLKRSALADEEPEDDPVERLRKALDGERRPEVERAWREVQNASGPDAREAIVKAEAALFVLVEERMEAALAEANASDAEAWLEVALLRADAENRTLPGPPTEGEPDAESLRQALDAAMAVRAREVLWKAYLLNATDRPEAAEATARGAEAMTELLVPNASQRLPAGEREAFEENASRVPEAILSAPADAGRYLFPSLAAGLTALQYDHDVEELEVLGQRPIDGARIVDRATREDPTVYEDLARAAFERYAVDRARLGLMGEGSNEAVDEAYLDLQDAVKADDREALRNATDEVRSAVANLALLGQGAVVTVESGGVRHNLTHKYDVSLVRPTLEGVGSYDVVLGYDGDVLDVVNVTPVASEGIFAWDGGGTSGDVTATFTANESIREAEHLFQLHLEAAGPPGDKTNVTVDGVELREPDGDRIETFLVRDGNVTIAQIETGDEPADGTETTGELDTDERSVPAAGLAGALPAGLAACAYRRLRR